MFGGQEVVELHIEWLLMKVQPSHRVLPGFTLFAHILPEPYILTPLSQKICMSAFSLSNVMLPLLVKWLSSLTKTQVFTTNKSPEKCITPLLFNLPYISTMLSVSAFHIVRSTSIVTTKLASIVKLALLVIVTCVLILMSWSIVILPTTNTCLHFLLLVASMNS